MELSLTTDYQSDTGCPEPFLRAIADAGFTHVHWCHHWNTDFVYGRHEIAQIGRWLSEFGLRLLDLHGSAGREKCWYSLRESERLAGVELVENRVRMTAELGGRSVVMHVPNPPPGEDGGGRGRGQREQVRRSIDELLPVIRETGVRLAIENMPHDDFVFLRELFAEYSPEELGLCYDCGHGNIGARQGLEHLEAVKGRLIAIHLHDNDGEHDQHWVPFTGSVDFGRLAAILAGSAYAGCISMESNMKGIPEAGKGSFLADALAAGRRLAGMVGEEGNDQ